MKARDVAKNMALSEFIRLGSMVDEKVGQPNYKFDVVDIKREDGLQVVVVINKKIETIKVA